MRNTLRIRCAKALGYGIQNVAGCVGKLKRLRFSMAHALRRRDELSA